jgi:hypothetical protein
MVCTRYRGLSLSSHFQPIFSIAHGRAVGYEGLIRAPRGECSPQGCLLIVQIQRNEHSRMGPSGLANIGCSARG